jgi:amino acid transporter
MTSLPRTLGLRDLILLTIGSVIGSGIFLVPGVVLRQVDDFILPAMLVWLVGGVLSLLGALTYGEPVVTLVNVLGTRASADLQNWTTATKVIGILLMSVALLWFGRGFRVSGPALWPIQYKSSLASGFGVAMIGVLWAYEGWQYVSYSAGEVVNAKRNLPLGLVIGTVALIGIYLIANLGYLAALGSTGVANSDSDLDLQRNKCNDAHFAARLLCDGARPPFLSTLG